MVDIIVVFENVMNSRAIKNILIRNNISDIEVARPSKKISEKIKELDEGVVILENSFYNTLLESDFSENVYFIVISSNVINEDMSGVKVLTIPFKGIEIIDIVNLLLDNIKKNKLIKKKKEKQKHSAYIKYIKERLMDIYEWDEEIAYRYIQKKSMNTGKEMIEIARELDKELE